MEKINSETIEGEKRAVERNEKMDKKPKCNKKTVLKLMHEKEGRMDIKRRKHNRQFHFYDGGETDVRSSCITSFYSNSLL